MTDWTSTLSRLFPRQDGEPPMRHRTAVVDAVNSDGTVDLDFDGTIIPGVSVLSSAVIGVGATVQVSVWRGDLLVLGSSQGDSMGGPLTVSATRRQNSEPQNITSGTVTGVFWQTDVKTDDPLGDYTYIASGGPETRIIRINRDGWYHVDAGILWSSNANGRRFVEIADSGTSIARLEDHPSTTGQYAQQVSTTRYMSSGDYFRVQVFQNSGVGMTVDSDARSFVAIYRVRG